jgi:hypothetical protein
MDLSAALALALSDTLYFDMVSPPTEDEVDEATRVDEVFSVARRCCGGLISPARNKPINYPLLAFSVRPPRHGAISLTRLNSKGSPPCQEGAWRTFC